MGSVDTPNGNWFRAKYCAVRRTGISQWDTCLLTWRRFMGNRRDRPIDDCVFEESWNRSLFDQRDTETYKAIHVVAFVCYDNWASDFRYHSNRSQRSPSCGNFVVDIDFRLVCSHVMPNLFDISSPIIARATGSCYFHFVPMTITQQQIKEKRQWQYYSFSNRLLFMHSCWSLLLKLISLPLVLMTGAESFMCSIWIWNAIALAHSYRRTNTFTN